MLPKTETVVSDTTSVDNVEVEPTEVTDEPTEDTSEEFTIEDLLNEDFSDYEEFATGVNHKGMKPLHEIMKHMVPEGRKHLANMRGMVTQKTQELADLRKELEAEREAIKMERELLLSGDFKKSIDDKAKEPEKPYDLFDEEGMQKKIEQEAAKMMQQMLKPLEEQQRTQQREYQINKFKTEHPDLMNDSELKVEVGKLLTARENLTLEDAYFIAKAKVLEGREAARAASHRESKGRRSEAFGKTSTGSNSSINGTPKKFANGWEAYQYFKNQGK